MDQLRVRCPACQKLYQVETEAIYSLTPHFECKACHTVFAFDYPPTSADEVRSFIVKQGEPQQEVSEPVILQAKPSLVQLWNQIFEDYDDHERHEDFIKRCQELEALPFARMKYQNLQSATGNDPLSEKYLKQIDSLMMVKAEQKAQTPVEPDKFMRWLQSSTMRRVGYWGPLALSILFVVIGFSDASMRNMIGFGVAIFVFQMLLTKVRL